MALLNITKLIYNYRGKTQQQLNEILLNEVQQHCRRNEGVVFDKISDPVTNEDGSVRYLIHFKIK